MILQNIAVFGATGNIGLAIIKGLLERKSEFNTIFAITSNDPNNVKFNYLRENGVKVEQADYTNHSSLVSVLKGKDAIILALSGPAQQSQIPIIDAAIEAGVKRVYPSEFGFDYTLPENQIPVFKEKLDTQKYLIEKAKEGKISYTIFVVGSFLDWSLVTAFLGIDLSKKTAELIDSDKKLAATPTQDIGRFLAASLVNSNVSHNKVIRVQSFAISTGEILAFVEKYSNSKFSVVHKSSKQYQEEANEHLAKNEILEFVIKSIRGVTSKTYGPLDNHLFPEVIPSSAEDVVKGVVEGKFDYFRLQNN